MGNKPLDQQQRQPGQRSRTGDLPDQGDCLGQIKKLGGERSESGCEGSGLGYHIAIISAPYEFPQQIIPLEIQMLGHILEDRVQRAHAKR